jgi:hypothetical protein
MARVLLALNIGHGRIRIIAGLGGYGEIVTQWEASE